MIDKKILKHITSKIAILTFLATLVATTTVNATETAKCSGKKVSCPNTATGNACTFIDSFGKERDGKVVTSQGQAACRGIVFRPPKLTLQKAQVLHKGKVATKDVIRGKVALKPQVAIVVLRDRETKRIIDITTTDSSGNFIFKNMTFRQGLEVGWGSPQEIGPPDEDEGFCYEYLEPDHGKPLELMVCEDVEFDFPPPPPPSE